MLFLGRDGQDGVGVVADVVDLEVLGKDEDDAAREVGVGHAASVLAGVAVEVEREQLLLVEQGLEV